MVASALVLSYAELEPYKASKVGDYIHTNMSHTMEAVRLSGLVVMMIGAWKHKPPLFPLGLAIILFGWFRGLIIRSK